MAWLVCQDFAEHLDGLMAAGDALNNTRFSVRGVDTRGGTDSPHHLLEYASTLTAAFLGPHTCLVT